MEDWVIIVIGSIIGVVSGKIGLVWLKTRTLDPEIVKKHNNIKDKYIKELELQLDDAEREVKSLKGKVATSKQVPKVMADAPPTKEGLDVFVEQYLPTLANSLPKEIGGLLLENKGAVMEFVKKNPDIVQRFLTKRSPDAKPVSPQDRAQNLAV